MTKPSKNLIAMIERKKLVRQNTPETDAKAERILIAVEGNGGLTTDEVYALMVH